jgi:membrane protease YdiL (CAAX protease family)
MEGQTKLAGYTWQFIVALGIILILEFTTRILLLPSSPRDVDIQVALALEWVLLFLLILLWIPQVEGNTLDSIGFRGFRFRYIWLGIFTYLVYLIASIGSSFIITALGLDPIRTLQPMISAYNPATLIGLFLTGTIVEEVFYRGYLIERLNLLINRKWIAGFISWFLFSLVHIRFFGIGPTLDVGVLSGFLVILYMKEKNLWPCIILHGINGIFVYILFPLMLAWQPSGA